MVQEINNKIGRMLIVVSADIDSRDTVRLHAQRNVFRGVEFHEPEFQPEMRPGRRTVVA